MVLIDSSIIIALFRESEKDHSKAKQLIECYPNMLILHEILIESLTVLKMKVGLKTTKQCYSFLNNHQQITILETSPETFQNTLSSFLQNNNKLSFIDTLLLTTGQAKNIPIATFDKDLNKACLTKK